MKFICQNCGEKGKSKWKFNHDPLSKFFYWPSHKDHTGLNIFALFCFSCGSINDVATKLFSSNLEYFRNYKLESSALKQWCRSHGVDEQIMSKLKKTGFIQ